LIYIRQRFAVTAGGVITRRRYTRLTSQPNPRVIISALRAAVNCDGTDFGGERLQEFIGSGHEGEVAGVGDQGLNDIVLANYFLLRALNSSFLPGDTINAPLVESFGKNRRLPCAKSPLER
jgi:hypothetical protein